MSQDIRVVVSGAMGKMGQTVVRGLLAEPDMVLVGAVDPGFPNQPVVSGSPMKVCPDLGEVLERVKADVLVDFTEPDTGGKNALLALEHGVRPVIGTTGLSDEEIAALESECETRGLGGALIPNFSLGIVALRRAAREVAALMPQAEILEMHHDHKLDAPSGTALNLRRYLEPRVGREIPIHSVRLPGLVAHHEVLFGALGQTLLLRHDTLNRDAFLPGILLTIRAILNTTGLKRDLDELL